MKRTIKLLSFILCCVACLSFFTSCGKSEDNPETLYIHINRAGNGDAFVYALAEKFTEIYGNKVEINSVPLNEVTRVKLKAGPKGNNVDLFMSIDQVFDLINMGENAIPGYDTIFADLSDVYDSFGYRSDVKVKDFMTKQVYDFYTTGGKQWIIPYVENVVGLVYNEEILKSAGITKLPRTTDELAEVCEVLKAHDIISFTYPGRYDYWSNIYTAWWMQYEGKENIDLFFQGKDYDGTYSVNCYKQPGRLYALEVLERLLKPSNGYADRNANTYEFTQAQVNYLEGNAAMMPTGDWLENEMRENFKDEKLNIKMMRTPVISKLGEKLGIDDETLRNIVDFADGATASRPDVDDNIIETVKKARSCLAGGTASAQAFIPSYSNAVTLAKNFLKLMYSPLGEEIFLKSTHGLTLPVHYDYTKCDAYDSFSVFQKSTLKLHQDTTFYMNSKKHPLFYAGGLTAFYVDSGCLEKNLGTNSKVDLTTARDLYVADIEYYSTRWESIMAQAGVSND